jgi:branched-chain amino acid transport system substrate-binding protein
MIRRVRSSLLAVLAIGVLAVACAPPGGEEEVAGGDVTAGASAPEDEAASEAPDDSASASGNAIRIGFIASTTGTAAASGEDMVRGWDLYWKLNGDTVAGRQVQTIHEDDGGDPQIGLNKAQRLVENEQVGLVVGPLFANVGYAIAEYLGEQGVPNFQQVSSADDLTQRGRIDGVLRVAGWTSSQTAHPAGQWAYDQGYRRAVTICSDYAFGHEYCGGFVNTFTDAGGEIVEQLWAPLGTQDFGTYMAQIEAADADVVFSVQVGGDSVRFVESWNSFGLKDSVPLLGGETLLDQSLLRNMGDEAEGLISVGKYAEGRDDPATTDFVEAFDAEYGDLPSYYAATSYTAAQWVSMALEEVDGDLEDTEAFLEATRGIELEAPGGPMRLDEYDNPVQNVYVRVVQRRDDGRLWNVPTETFDNVSQFWEYDPQEFLDHPVYSRDYQGNGVWPEPRQ